MPAGRAPQKANKNRQPKNTERSFSHISFLLHRPKSNGTTIVCWSLCGNHGFHRTTSNTDIDIRLTIRDYNGENMLIDTSQQLTEIGILIYVRSTASFLNWAPVNNSGWSTAIKSVLLYCSESHWTTSVWRELREEPKLPINMRPEFLQIEFQ